MVCQIDPTKCYNSMNKKHTRSQLKLVQLGTQTTRIFGCYGMKIAVIGTGSVGKTLGRLWAENGHEVMFGSRDAQRGVGVSAEIPLTSGATIKAAAQIL